MEIKKEDLKLRNSLPEEIKMKIETIEHRITPVLTKTTGINYEFTEHGLPHSIVVEKIYDELLNNDNSKLNDTEKFLLITATLLHDIGMVGKAQYAKDPDYAVESRDSHNINTKKIIREIYAMLNLDRGEADYIADIAEAHRSKPIEEMEEIKSLGIGNLIRFRLLGALLRIADELHLTYDRSDDIIRKVIKPGIISMKHHEKHLAIQGIARHGKEIIVYATAELWDVEDELRKSEKEVNKKLEECKEILNKHISQTDSINFNIKVLDIVKKELILTIANSSQATSINELFLDNMKKIFPNKDRTHNVKDALMDLEQEHIVIKHQSNKYQLNKKERIFEELLSYFLDTKYELNFVNSVYIKEYLQENLLNLVSNRFGHHFNSGELEDRLLVLTNSPTALKYIFTDKHMRCKSGIIDKRAIFDLSLIQGYTIDSILYPSIAEDKDVRLAIQAINLNIGTIVNDFVTLIGALPAAAEKTKQLIKTPEDTTNEHKKDNEQTQKIITVTHQAESDVPIHAVLPTIIFASQQTGLPIHISKDIHVKYSDPDMNPITTETSGFYEFIPIMQKINYPIITKPCRLLSDNDTGILKIIVPKDISSYKMDTYPFFSTFLFENIHAQTLTINHYSDTCAEDILFLSKCFENVSNRKYRRLIIESDKGEILVKSVPPPFIENKLSKEECELLSKIEKLLGNKIPAGYKINNNTIINLYELLNNCKSSEEAIIEYDKIYRELSDKKRTNIFILLKSNDHIEEIAINTDIPGWLDCTTFNPKYRDNKSKKSWMEIFKKQKGFIIGAGIRKLTPKDIYDKVKTIFYCKDKPLERILSYILRKDPKETLEQINSVVKVYFKDAKRNGLFNVQDVEIVVSDIDREFARVNQIETLIKEKKYIEAIPLMEEMESSNESIEEDLAFAYYIDKQYSKAIEASNEAIRFDRNTTAYFTKGLAYISIGDYHKAFHSYREGFNNNKKGWQPAKEIFEEILREKPELEKEKYVQKIKKYL